MTSLVDVKNGLISREIFVNDDLYQQEKEQVDLQLSRDPFPLPILKLNPDVESVFDFKFEDFTLVNYESHPHIKGAVAV